MNKVYLIGAGPGDPQLLTIKAEQLLKQADVCIYDRLVSKDILSLCDKTCEMIYVGKQSHNHSMEQDDINKLLVEKAEDHEVVVRLKGGDPYVFGRGGEEALYCLRNHVEVEVVPGISSALAGCTYAGIPITHRGVATGFRVISAHDKKDHMSDIDFKSIASSNDTCVFLMGLSLLKELMDNLVEAGIDNATPVAVVSNATTNMQRKVVGTVATIAELADNAQLASPAIIIVGQVVNFTNTLDFFEQRPLFGKKLLVVKINNEISKLSTMLSQQGASVDEVCVGRILYHTNAFNKEDLNKCTYLVFTSKNAVNGFFENLHKLKLDTRALANIKIVAVGEGTRDALNTQGLIIEQLPKEYTSQQLCGQIEKEVHKDDTVWFVRGKDAASVFEQRLKDLCNYENVVVYENDEVEVKDSLDGEKYDGVIFTNASSCKRLLDNKRVSNMNKPTIFAIGPVSAKAVEEYGLEVVVADKYTYKGLFSKILAYYQNKDIDV